jgi:hypothetical protein
MVGRDVDAGDAADPTHRGREHHCPSTAGDVEQAGISIDGSQVDQTLGEVRVVSIADSVVGRRRPIEHARQPRLVVIDSQRRFARPDRRRMAEARIVCGLRRSIVGVETEIMRAHSRRYDALLQSLGSRQ